MYLSIVHNAWLRFLNNSGWGFYRCVQNLRVEKTVPHHYGVSFSIRGKYFHSFNNEKVLFATQQKEKYHNSAEITYKLFV